MIGGILKKAVGGIAKKALGGILGKLTGGGGGGGILDKLKGMLGGILGGKGGGKPIAEHPRHARSQRPFERAHRRGASARSLTHSEPT